MGERPVLAGAAARPRLNVNTNGPSIEAYSNVHHLRSFRKREHTHAFRWGALVQGDTLQA